MFEYCGSAIRALSMEERMTVCNMSIEGGARAGLVAPDDTTYQYMAGRPYRAEGRGVGRGRGTLAAVAHRRGRGLRQEHHDRRVDAGTDDHVRHESGHGHSDHRLRCRIPATLADPLERDSLAKALRYMDLQAGQAAAGASRSTWCSSEAAPIRAFRICATAAAVLKGRKVNPGVRVMVVPGSQQVKRQAQAEGLDQIFRDAGAEWREAGCSMCIAMNGDQLQPGEYSVSTSNRNFEGRQGKGGRTFLASPLTAAAAAITGVVADVEGVDCNGKVHAV